MNLIKFFLKHIWYIYLIIQNMTFFSKWDEAFLILNLLFLYEKMNLFNYYKLCISYGSVVCVFLFAFLLSINHLVLMNFFRFNFYEFENNFNFYKLILQSMFNDVYLFYKLIAIFLDRLVITHRRLTLPCCALLLLFLYLREEYISCQVMVSINHITLYSRVRYI